MKVDHVIAPAASLEEEGHRFRGKFINLCAEIEAWLRLTKNEKRGNGPLFGQRIASVRKLAEDQVNGSGRTFRYPRRVVDLLNQLQPFVDLRSALAHGVQDIRLQPDGQAIFFYAIPGPAQALAPACSLAAQEQILRELGRNARELRQQRWL
jgi:hypothetical protein